MKILGRIVRRDVRGIIIEADPRHAQSIVEHLELVGANGVTTPCEVQKEILWTYRAQVQNKEDILEQVEGEPLAAERARVYRGLAAILNYLAQDRLDLKFAALPPSRNRSSQFARDVAEILQRVGT